MILATSWDLPVDRNLGRMSQGLDMRVVAEGAGTLDNKGQKMEFSVHSVTSQKMKVSSTPVP
jgi:hypothetical protein